MHKHLSKRPKLLIVSDTPMRMVKDAEYEAYEPVVREIENMEHIFTDITWIGYNYNNDSSRSNLRKINSNKVNYIFLERTGGSRLSDKLNILLKIIPYFIIILKEIRKNDIIHTRAPSLPAFLAIIASIFFNKKKYWHKYAGNWIQKNAPFSYSIQRWLLNMNIGNSKVTINGVWPSQNQNILSFENPCLTEVELESSTIIAKQKDYSGKLNLCFVGRLEPAKGALIILELLQNLEDVDWIDTFYIIGDGPSKNIIENKKPNLHLKVCLTGWLLREQLNEIYTKCHLIILPSYASEGFPKVLAEAASYGCVPIVSNLSSISQYINNNISGVLIDDLTQSNIKSVLSNLSNKREKLMSMASSALKWVSLFTYSRYVFRIEKEIINE